MVVEATANVGTPAAPCHPNPAIPPIADRFASCIAGGGILG